MGRLSKVVPQPPTDQLVSDEEIFQIRFGKRVLPNGEVINPFSYDPYDPQSILRATEKMAEAFDYLHKKELPYRIV